MKKVFIVLVVVIIFVLGGFLLLTSKANTALETMLYEKIDMELVADGTYQGETNAGLVLVKVDVSVKDHAIVNIDIIEHQNGFGGKAETITDRMIERNNFDVDAVSGATLSSEAIKSAVSKALKKGYSD
jgi:uncharacterized protein with FMN-binding domain